MNGTAAPSTGAPAAPLSERELAELAVAARQVKALDGRPPDQAATSPQNESEQTFVPTGRVRAALTGLRDGRRKVDLRIHDDALVVASGGDDPGVGIPLEQVVAITVTRQPWGGTVHIGAGGRGSRTLRFSKRKHSCNDVAAHLQGVDPRRFALVPMSNALQLAYRVGVAAIALMVVAAIAVPVKLVFFPAAQPGDDLPAAARTAMREACPSWRSSPMTGAALVSTAAQLRPAFETAAAASEVFATLPADLGIVEGFAPKAGRPDVPLVEAAAFSGAVDRIDSACTRVGA